MNTVEFMNVLASNSKSKTNRDLAIMAGIGILVIGGVCYYYYTQNQELKLRHKNNMSQMSDLSSQLSAIQERMINMQIAYNELFKRNNYLKASAKMLGNNETNILSEP
jgi:hypothetical protein